MKNIEKYACPFTNQTILSYIDGDGTKGTAVSQNYRIPALVTLPDGTLVAAADARWNTYFDGGGLDTAVAYSEDCGKTWTAYLANYLGDHGNEWNRDSTTFIDPALAADGDSLYLLVDLYPYGIALNGANSWPVKDTGMSRDGKLLLTKGSRTTKLEDYHYYMGDICPDTGYARICTQEGEAVWGYLADAKFNLFSEADHKYLGNLFMENGIFEVMPAAYLYLTMSKDGGKSWSDPRLLNVKTEEEFACLIGPGRGITTSHGLVVFPCYSFQRQQTSLLYSADHGNTWMRLESLTDDTYWSGEACVLELNDGTLRCFFRNGTSCLCYADVFVDEDGMPIGWSKPVKTEVRINSNTQLSALRYSKKVDNREVIFISCSTGKGDGGSDSCQVEARANGKILAAFLDEENKICVEKTYDITVNDAFFAYSCLTELQDGSIGILYEKESTELAFSVIRLEEKGWK